VTRLQDIGEKRLIAEIVRPLFNPDRAPGGVGDDCAIFEVPPGHELIASTDRIPANLTGFCAGILDHRGLGDYLGRLNLSDIAASGGRPLGVLFNAGVPASMRVHEFAEVCGGLAAAAERAGCAVLGGDVSISREMSLSATVLGAVPHGRGVLRRGAAPGDAVFITRPPGLTPAALATVASEDPALVLDQPQAALLEGQFSSLEPLLDLGASLREAGATSLMDNTDGLGQTLAELAEASGTAFVVERARLHLPSLVSKVAAALGRDPVEFALGPGADFSLVGTVPPGIVAKLPAPVVRVGTVEDGEGIWLDDGSSRRRINAPGWSYFCSSAPEVEMGVVT
jgi:thiamine-monophosphate kinase